MKQIMHQASASMKNAPSAWMENERPFEAMAELHELADNSASAHLNRLVPDA